jgi:hypothetical protein
MYQDLLSKVTENPEDDASRLAFASEIRASEPDRATFIEAQIEEAKRRRGGRYPVNSLLKHPLLTKHEEEWGHTFAKYTRSFQFDRGFITKVEMDPFMFLEYGEWLFINAPIRMVQFASPDTGEFPMAELAASPLLEHLDAISVYGPVLSGADLLELARSRHLRRLQFFAPGSKREIGEAVYEAFAAHPDTRKMLRFLVTLESFPGQRFGDAGRDDMSGAAVEDWSEMPAAGKALENTYGYIPWLHGENACEPFDAGYFVANHILPVKAAGASVG